MISTIQLYLAKRLLFASSLAMLAIFFPVLMIELISQLPSAALSSDLMWPALVGLAPTIFYVTLPVVVAVAIIVSYSELSTEGTLTILYSAGLSVLNVRIPAFIIASLAVILGYFTSCVLSPRGASQLEDVMYVIENDLSPSLIAPQRFYTLNGGRRVIQYQERINKNWITGVFMRDVDNNNDEEVIFARDAFFERRENESWLILRDGYIQYSKSGKKSEDIIAFKQITRATGLAGDKLPKRKWTGFFEMGLVDFLNQYSNAMKDPRRASQWASEALERFGIPILALTHTMLGLALVAIWGGNTGRGSKLNTAIIACSVLLIHFLTVLACEFVSSQGMALSIFVVVTISIEIIISVLLFLHTLRPPRPSISAHRQSSTALYSGTYRD